MRFAGVRLLRHDNEVVKAALSPKYSSWWYSNWNIKLADIEKGDSANTPLSSPSSQEA